MNTNDSKQSAGNGARDVRLQEDAERAERLGLPAGGDAGVDRYRLVMRALRQPLAAQLPADFAARLAARVVQPEERGSGEDWLVSIVLFCVGAAGLFYLQPVMASVLAGMHFHLPHVPWALLGGGAVAIAVAWVLDRGASHLRH